MAKVVKTTKVDLPAGIVVADTKWPEVKFDAKGKIGNPDEQVDYNVGDSGTLTFYKTESFGWCLATLPISKGKRGAPDRTYGLRVEDGQTVRIGNGPHVTQTVRIYLRKGRMEALKKYVDLYVSGLVKANTTRDRISSRRAQGVEMRAAGRTSWMWNT